MRFLFGVAEANWTVSGSTLIGLSATPRTCSTGCWPAAPTTPRCVLTAGPPRTRNTSAPTAPKNAATAPPPNTLAAPTAAPPGRLPANALSSPLALLCAHRLPKLHNHLSVGPAIHLIAKDPSRQLCPCLALTLNLTGPSSLVLGRAHQKTVMANRKGHQAFVPDALSHSKMTAMQLGSDCVTFLSSAAGRLPTMMNARRRCSYGAG